VAQGEGLEFKPQYHTHKKKHRWRGGGVKEKWTSSSQEGILE
jgi:hypothetical protein